MRETPVNLICFFLFWFRLGQEQFLGSFEENENRKNQVSHMTSYPRRESSPNKENTGAKPPLGQRDAAVVQPRSQLSITTIESPAVDRKSFSPSILGERKCISPSVLRKFGAMLQENEGKMLTESGVVTHQGLGPEPKCPTPGCQRRALGATAAAGRALMRVPTQKCQADSDMLTAEIELGQDWGLVSDSGRQNQKDQRGGYSGPKGSQRSPQPSQRRAQMAGSPKIRPRANSGADRDGGLAQGERARRPSPQHVEPKMDYRVSSASSGAQKIQRGGLAGQDCSRVRDEGLIELLDMLEIQHEYSSSPRTGHTAYREGPQQVGSFFSASLFKFRISINSTTATSETCSDAAQADMSCYASVQVNPAELSPAKPNKSFSRPARPANQRPPSRWASRTPTARITSPSGPMYRPPSPLARPPSPMTRTPSPALKHRPLISYSLQTETVIM